MKLNIKILFENNNFERKDRGWGLAWLLNDVILFDTCENYTLLKEGLDFFNTDIKSIRHIVISHDHWDHTGGLLDFISTHPEKRHLNVHILPGFSTDLKQSLLESGVTLHLNTFPSQINEHFFLSGQIEGRHKDRVIFEQSLVFKVNNYFALFTGCAHPGIINIMNYVKDTVSFDAKLKLIIGGFHMKSADVEAIEKTFTELKSNECLVGPAHCSGLECINYFRENGGNNFLQIRKKSEYNLEIG